MITEIGKVIRIIDDFTIIINAGKKHLSVGQIIQIYEIGEPIKNLDGSVLDYFYFIKDELEVVQVEELYSICKKDKVITNTIDYSLVLSPLLQREKKERVPLNVDKTEIEPLNLSDSKIHVGDSVKLA